MKRILTCVVSICLLLSCLAMGPRKAVRAADTQPKGPGLTSKSITVVKGQYAFVGLTGTNSGDKITWSVSGNNLKIHKSGESDESCYVKAVKPGEGTLKCTVNKKILKCRVKVLADAAFIGDFCDDSGEVYLNLFKSGKKYVAFYSQFRLARLEWLTGTVKNGMLTLKGKDPSDKPITVTVLRKGKKRIFTFKETTWEYFEQGSTVELKKCSGKKGYEQALSGADLTYLSYF